MNTEIPHLKIERLANGCIRLENESMGDSYMVDVHPLHLRYMAEQLGLVGAMSDTEAQALRTVDKLTRRLNLLHERIAKMDSWLWEHRDFDEADINVEVWFSKATLDLSTEFQAEISEASRHVTPRHAESRSLKTSENGGLQATQKRGCSNAPQPTDNPAETQRVTKPAQMELQP